MEAFFFSSNNHMLSKAKKMVCLIVVMHCVFSLENHVRLWGVLCKRVGQSPYVVPCIDS